MSYLCDPQRNTACRKGLVCFLQGGPCGLTDRPEYALRDFLGTPVRAEEKEEEDEKDGK